MPYTLSVQNVYGEEIKSFDLRSDNTYQDEAQIIPNTLGEVRVSDNNDVAPNKFTQGLYKYNVTYTDILQYTNEASEDFYFMGEQNLYQNEDEILIMVGVDSMFTEKINVTSENFSLDLEVINGCGILKTSDIPLNKEMMLTITISSHDEQHTYKRALVHAGNSWGAYRQQLLIIDRDFDGVEDLYDNDLSESEIQESYAAYRELYPLDSNSSNDDSLTDSNTTESGNQSNTTNVKDNIDDPIDMVDDSGDYVDPIDMVDDSTDWLPVGEDVDMVGDDDDSAGDFNNYTSDPDQFTNLGNGWSNVGWLGTLFDTSSGWSYHTNLKWIYPVFDSSGSLWFWQENLGWCWTANNIFPYVFQNENNWIYLEYSDPKNLRYYDFVLKKRIGF